MILKINEDFTLLFRKVIAVFLAFFCVGVLVWVFFSLLYVLIRLLVYLIFAIIILGLVFYFSQNRL